MKRQTIWQIISIVITIILLILGSHILQNDRPTQIKSTDADTKITSSTPQFVLLSFDGSKDVSILDKTLTFEQEMQSASKPIHFTYFINAAYFLTNSNSKLYRAPEQASGTSAVGFSDSLSDIVLRVKEFNKAYSMGNEIGSHTVGHYNGSYWSKDNWALEFSSFTSIMNNIQKNNPSIKIDTPIFNSNIHGFRAPDLSVNDNLYKVLSESGFTYDGSGVNIDDVWPTKDKYGIWHIPLGTIYLGTDMRPVISMDYSIWARQSNNKEVAIKGTPLWNQYYNELETAYMNYFNKNYNENRGPVVIANHFSTWNDSVYWEAMKTFARNVCGKQNVKCVTYSDLVKYLNTTGVPEFK